MDRIVPSQAAAAAARAADGAASRTNGGLAA